MKPSNSGLRRNLVTASAMLLIGIQIQASTAQEIYTVNDELGVTPSALQTKNSYEIADLIYYLMQPTGEQPYFPWDTMANSDIIWNPEGIRHQDSMAYRNGAARINILGQVSTVLKAQVVELAWKLSYFTHSNPGFGATQVVMSAGGSGEGNACFGVGNTMCSFDIEASLKESGLNFTKEKVCAPNSQTFLDMYTVSRQGYQEMYALLETNSGSGGASTTMWLTMDESLFNIDKEPCNY